MAGRTCLTVTQTTSHVKSAANLHCEGWTHYSLMVGGVGCLVVTVCSSMWQLMLASTLFSFGLATFWALLNTLLANEFGAESMASSWGFFRMVQGITSFIYPSFHGEAVLLMFDVFIYISHLYQLAAACLT